MKMRRSAHGIRYIL